MAAAWALIALWWAFTAASYLFLAATYLARVASHLLRSTVPILGVSFSMSMSLHVVEIPQILVLKMPSIASLAFFFSSSAASSARLVGQALLRTVFTEALFLASGAWPASRSLLSALMAASIALLLSAKSWA